MPQTWSSFLAFKPNYSYDDCRDWYHVKNKGCSRHANNTYFILLSILLGHTTLIRYKIRL